MSYRFIHITEADNSELLKLFNSANTGSEAFRISRGTDFFALAKEYGIANYYGVLKNNTLAAVLAVTEQQRYIRGSMQKTFYMHDLRMHPVLGTVVAYYRLLSGVSDIYTNNPDCSWTFSIILEANPHRTAITKGKHLFPAATEIGTIVHAGLPLFYGTKNYSRNLQTLSADEAWSFYTAHAKNTDFALADERHFKLPNGTFIGIRQNGTLAAIAKITDQSAVRQIVASRPASVVYKLLNMYSRIKKCKGFPDTGEAFHHCYLSYYTAASTCDFRKEFIAYVRRHYANKYTYVFCGMHPEDALPYKTPFMIRFQSKVFAYGEHGPLSFQFPDLTLI